MSEYVGEVSFNHDYTLALSEQDIDSIVQYDILEYSVGLVNVVVNGV